MYTQAYAPVGAVSWMVQEQSAFYDPAKDALLQTFIAQIQSLNVEVVHLQNLRKPVSIEEEQRLHFMLDAVLDMRRELIREARLRE